MFCENKLCRLDRPWSEYIGSPMLADKQEIVLVICNDNERGPWSGGNFEFFVLGSLNVVTVYGP